jgi:hypothetical protein
MNERNPVPYDVPLDDPAPIEPDPIGPEPDPWPGIIPRKEVAEPTPSQENFI